MFTNKSLKHLKISMKNQLKRTKNFTKKQISQFREDLEESTEEIFKEQDRNKRKAWIRAKEIILD
jgi:hypothetical protein